MISPAPTSDINRIASQAIIHLHGQSHGLALLNSAAETDRHAKSLRPLLRETLRNHVTIVAGYSGEADGAFGVIEEEYNDHNHLLWLGYSKEPPQHLKTLLENNYATYYGDCDFDRTMIEIAQNLGHWPPIIMENPMTHLLDELAEVTGYPVEKGTDIDVLTSTRDRLEIFAGRWQWDETADDRAYSKLVSRTDDRTILDSNSISIDELSDDGKEALAWEFISHGNALKEEADTLTGEPAIAKFEAAGEEYKRATMVKPDMHEAFNGWGNALGGEARNLTGKAVIEKFIAAGKKYQHAVDISPDDHDSFYNWGIMLLTEARTLTGKAKDDRYARAEVILSKAKTISKKANYNLACLYAMTNRPDDAVDELLACKSDGTLPNYAHLSADLDMEPLRNDPRYIALLESIKPAD